MQHLFTKKRKAYRRRSRALLRYAILVVLILGLSYLYVWQRVYSLKLAQERARRQHLVKELEDKCRAVSFEIAQLSSMQRIEDIAMKKLGMSPLKESQVISYPSYREQRAPGQVQAAGSSNKSTVDGQQAVVKVRGE
jgi:cell division protein FtsL